MENLAVTHFSGECAAWGAQMAALSPAPWPMQADYNYGEIALGSGRKLRRLIVRQDGRPVAAVQALGRGPLWLIGRGPHFAAGTGADLQRLILRRAARALGGVVIATPEVPVAGFGLIPLVTPRHQAIWDLGDPDVMRAGLDPKWRNRLVRAEGAGLRIRTERDPAWIIAAEATQRATRRYRALPPEFVTAWGQVGGGMLALSVRDPSGARLAGGIFLRHGAGASYHIGYTSPAGRAQNAHNLMLWQAACRLAQEGCRQLDLGDIDTEAGRARAHFKRGTGARVHRLGATVLVLPR